MKAGVPTFAINSFCRNVSAILCLGNKAFQRFFFSIFHIAWRLLSVRGDFFSYYPLTPQAYVDQVFFFQ